MKKVLCILLLVGFFSSCDDGEIIVTDFNFDAGSSLQFCKVSTTNVLYIINANPSESIAFTFEDESFDGTFADSLSQQTQQIRNIQLSSSNPLVYRGYASAISEDYFCSGIPPTEPAITSEYKATTGTIEVITSLIDTQFEDSTLVKTFLTQAIAHDITLKSTSGEDEIIKETLELGAFEKTEHLE